LAKTSPTVLLAHPGRQHSHQAALALRGAGILGCYATGVPISTGQISAPWKTLLGRFSVYDELNLPLELTRVNMIAPVVNRLLSRYLAEYLVGPIQYEAYRIFDRWVARIVERNHFDAVITYENSALHTFEAARKTGAKCILDAASLHHVEQDRYYESSLPTFFKARVDRLKDAEIGLADCIFTTSDLAAKSYVENIEPRMCVQTIPLGVDIERFTPAEKKESSDRLPMTFIFVGSATAKKGFDVTLEAMQVLLGEGHSLRLLIAGVADQKLLAARKEMRASIVEYGMVSHTALPSILTTADCLLLPSRFDSFGMAVVEAMACGVPAIVSDMVGAKQLVQDHCNGFVVPVGCVRSLIDRMRWCILHPEQLKEMSSNARKTAEQMSWARYRERFAAGVLAVLGQ
jgi:glycosyltransferase involved in cell wall biosynthesis